MRHGTSPAQAKRWWRGLAAGLGLLLGLLLGLAGPARAAVATAAHADLGAPGTRVVEGRVASLERRVDPDGYPVTDVVLEPGGERFTILGGYKSGLLWIVDEEAAFALGERVRVRLESAPRGARVAGGQLGVLVLEAAPGAAVAPAATADSLAPAFATVTSVTPASGPAVADDDIPVEVRGRGFGETQGGSAVLFQDYFQRDRGQVLSWSDTLIRCLVPKPGFLGSPQVLSGTVKVWTPTGGWSDGDPWTGGAEYHVLFQFAGDRWSQVHMPVDFYLNPAGFPWSADAIHEVVAQSAGTWAGAPFAFGRFALRGFTDKRAMRDKDSTNVISWTSPWPHAPGWLAVTWSGLDSLTGERREVDVEVNGDKPWSISDPPAAGCFDLPTAMTHEFGHWLRLGHVQEPEHVMLGYQNAGDVRRVLQDGDRQGAAWVYPTFGIARASLDTVHVVGPDPDTLVLDVQIADRRGRPLAGLAPGDVYAVAEWLDGNAGPVSSLPAAPPGIPALLPVAPTDAEGRTRIVVSGLSGSGDLRFTVVADGRSVLGRPIVRVTDAPRVRPPAALALGAPRPNPTRTGAMRTAVTLAVAVPRLVARVLDARGRLVRVLHDGPAAAGELWLECDLSAGAAGPGPGLYFLQVQGAGATLARKFVVLGR
jgi:hypothetical protein